MMSKECSDNVKIALVGNPNAGKTTIFNYLTDRCEKVGNWHGVTVEASSAKAKSCCPIDFVDLPGIYSVNVGAKKDSDDVTGGWKSSLDEQETCKFIRERRAQYVINVVDASHMQRDVHLTLQLIEMGYPVLIVINKIDLIKNSGNTLDISLMQERLGCKVVAIDARRKSDLRKLDRIIDGERRGDYFLVNSALYDAKDISDENKFLSDAISSFCGQTSIERWQVVRILDGDDPSLYCSTKADVAKIVQLVTDYNAQSEEKYGDSLDIIIVNRRYALLEYLCGSFKGSNRFSNVFGFNFDKIFLNKFLALPILIVILQLMFVFTMNVGGYMQNLFYQVTQLFLLDSAYIVLEPVLSLSPYIRILFTGLCSAVQTLLSFAPIIWSLYFFLAILEESGYMGRAILTVERIMNKLHLPGKAIVPLIIGFGCNVPAIMTTRSIEDKKQRIMTVMMIPFVSCSARLTIFVLFGAVFFPYGSAYIIMLLHIIGIMMAIFTNYIFGKYYDNGNKMSDEEKYRSYFILELPRFSLPRISVLLKIANYQVKQFVFGVGRNIIIFATVLNVLALITISGGVAKNMDDSLLHGAAQIITPVLRPMGIDDDNWQAAVGLLTGISAKEVLVSTLTTLYSTEASLGTFSDGGDVELNKEGAFIAWYNDVVSFLRKVLTFNTLINEEENSVDDDVIVQNDLKMVMKEKFRSLSGVVAYLIFILLYFPCISVYSSIRSELSTALAIMSVLWSTGLGYVTAVIFYQVHSSIMCDNASIYKVALSMVIALVLLMSIIASFLKVIVRKDRG